MPAKMAASLTDEKRDLRKQMGCMKGIFQLFDRRHFLTGRSISRILLVGAQQQMEPQNATKAAEKDLEKRRASSESSQASTSSSSLDYNKQINISENRFQIKEQRHPLRNSQQSPDIRDVVKDSMYREARKVPIKSFVNDEREVRLTHIDSPRPSKFRKPKATVYEGSKDERLTLARFSYHGRESQDVFKKPKELPRFSLDSKPSSINHNRSNSIVTKLMGMDAFPDSITTDESSITKIKSTECPSPIPRVAFLSSTTAEGRKQKQVSPRSHNANSIKKTTMCSMLPIEPAPWKQQSYNQGSPKMATRIGKAGPHTSSSVYGEIEKRIAELEFKRSGKDLRALKQILEAMQKTRERLEKRGGGERSSLEHSSFDQNNNISNNQTFKRSSSNQVTRIKSQNVQTQIPKHHRDDQAYKENAKYRTLRNNNMIEAHQLLPSIGKKFTRRNLDSKQTSERDCRMLSPRVHHIVLKTEGESRPKSSTTESGRVKKQSSKKVREKCSNRKHRTKSADDDQLSNLSSETRYSSCLGDTASTKSESNNSMASHIETDIISSNSREQQDYVTTSKAQMPAVKFAVIMNEQPSPVSVLEASFYSEGSPSPVKKISSAFRDDSPNPDEVEWHIENLNHLTDYRKSDSDYKYNQKSENLHLFQEPKLKTEDNRAAADHNEPDHRSINPAHRYISKMILASPLQMKLSQEIQRKVVPDLINEILAGKMISGGLFTMGRKMMTLQGIIKEVYLEMDHLCRMPYCNPDDEDDGLIRLLTTDMKYQKDDWTDYCGEVPALVLDIERLIFKDLINEIVTCEVVCSRDRPKRQLFAKKSLNLPL